MREEHEENWIIALSTAYIIIFIPQHNKTLWTFCYCDCCYFMSSCAWQLANADLTEEQQHQCRICLNMNENCSYAAVERIIHLLQLFLHVTVHVFLETRMRFCYTFLLCLVFWCCHSHVFTCGDFKCMARSTAPNVMLRQIN